MLEFAVHQVFRQAVFGDTVAQHPTGLWVHLEYFAVVALERKIVRAGETGRASPDKGHLLACRWVLNEGHRGLKQAHLGPIPMPADDHDFFFTPRPPPRLLANAMPHHAHAPFERPP